MAASRPAVRAAFARVLPIDNEAMTIRAEAGLRMRDLYERPEAQKLTAADR